MKCEKKKAKRQRQKGNNNNENRLQPACLPALVVCYHVSDICIPVITTYMSYTPNDVGSFSFGKGFISCRFFFPFFLCGPQPSEFAVIVQSRLSIPLDLAILPD
jgi:hypothetical protein